MFGSIPTETGIDVVTGTRHPCLGFGHAAGILDNIKALRSGIRRGTWDVFCWHDMDVLFVESKWKRNDRLSAAQLDWLEVALGLGFPLSSFLIVEWEISRGFIHSMNSTVGRR